LNEAFNKVEQFVQSRSTDVIDIFQPLREEAAAASAGVLML
jgi:hypothetical protein